MIKYVEMKSVNGGNVVTVNIVVSGVFWRSFLVLVLTFWGIDLAFAGRPVRSLEPGLSDVSQVSQQLNCAMVFVPELPGALSFAGERVPFEYPDVRQALEREILVTMYSHSRTLQTLRATRRYFDIIDPILKQHGVPEDFKYLCMAESGLNPEAVSPAKAAGLWQFMVATGKSYGLECGAGKVDLRFQVEAATHAACKYLLESYACFGNWTLVAASYNVGRAGVSRRLQGQMVSDYYDLYLPEETMRYIHRILAFKVITSAPAKYGFMIGDGDYLLPFRNYKKVEIGDSEINWSAFAKQHGTTYKMLRSLNPWIRDYDHQNGDAIKYTVLVPTPVFRQAGQ